MSAALQARRFQLGSFGHGDLLPAATCNAPQPIVNTRNQGLFESTKVGNCLVVGIELILLMIVTDYGNAATAEAIQLSQNTKGEWQLKARQAELPQLLDVIASRSGTRIHYSSLPESKVDATCLGDAAALLHCVLGQTANMAYQQSDEGRSSEIWIMGSSLANSELGKITCPALPETRTVPAIDPVQATENWLISAKAKDPAQRAQAMAELATGDSAYDLQIRNTLNQGLKDPNPQVRLQALEALTKREGDSTTSEQIRQALNDSVLDVRLMAVERIETDSNLLQLATQNSEAMVRELAQAKLEQLNQP